MIRTVEDRLNKLDTQRNSAAIQVQTLGGFRLWRATETLALKSWGRDTTLQLFQFLITARHRHGLRKEQIIDRLWPDLDTRAGEQNFKVALHGVNKVLEPDRPKRTDPRFIVRQGLTYQLQSNDIWIDVEALQQYIAVGNQCLVDHPTLAQRAYRNAIDLHKGIYLPNRLYEDWSSEERENTQVLILGAMITLGELLLDTNPMESVRLAQNALQLDPAWEDAYRIQMEAYFRKGNRPLAIKAYRQCEKVLDKEFGIPPLPETKKLLGRIMGDF